MIILHTLSLSLSHTQVSQLQPHGHLPKDVKKDDIMSLFEKSTISSPYALHQQQMGALLAQQQSLLMTAIASSADLQIRGALQ